MRQSLPMYIITRVLKTLGSLDSDVYREQHTVRYSAGNEATNSGQKVPGNRRRDYYKCARSEKRIMVVMQVPNMGRNSGLG